MDPRFTQQEWVYEVAFRELGCEKGNLGGFGLEGIYDIGLCFKSTFFAMWIRNFNKNPGR
jgi:hypothetical protein